MGLLWAVCLYIEGGVRDGEYMMEFVRASSQDEAEADALNLNESGDWEHLAVVCAASCDESF